MSTTGSRTDNETSTVMAWVAAYERAWREQGDAQLADLFTEDARYLCSPYEAPLDGLAAIGGFWPDPTPFTMTAEPVAVQLPHAVVRVEVQYGGDRPQEYRDLWVLRFAADGRAEHFEEWAYWPGKPYTSGSEGGAAEG